MKLLKKSTTASAPEALRVALEVVERAQLGEADPRAALDAAAAALRSLPGAGGVAQVTWPGGVYEPDDDAGDTVVPLATAGAEPGAPDVALRLTAQQREMFGALLRRDVDVATCVACGCTEESPCPGGCAWVTHAGMVDLCSACSACAEPCRSRGCGSSEDLDASDPLLVGWIRVTVAGADGGPVWVCSPRCAVAAMVAAGDELAEDDQADTAGAAAAAGLESVVVRHPASVALAGVLDAVVLDGWDLREHAEPDTTGVRWVHLTGWALTAVPEEGDYHLVDAVLPGRDPLHGIDVELAGEKPSDDFDSQFVQLRWPAEARSGGGR